MCNSWASCSAFSTQVAHDTEHWILFILQHLTSLSQMETTVMSVTDCYYQQLYRINLREISNDSENGGVLCDSWISHLSPVLSFRFRNLISTRVTGILLIMFAENITGAIAVVSLEDCPTAKDKTRKKRCDNCRKRVGLTGTLHCHFFTTFNIVVELCSDGWC